VTVELVPDLDGLGPRLAEVAAGIGIVGIGSGLYLMTRLGAGGKVGIGTLAFALLIGPAVQATVGAMSSTPAHEP